MAHCDIRGNNEGTFLFEKNLIFPSENEKDEKNDRNEFISDKIKCLTNQSSEPDLKSNDEIITTDESTISEVNKKENGNEVNKKELENENKNGDRNENSNDNCDYNGLSGLLGS